MQRPILHTALVLLFSITGLRQLGAQSSPVPMEEYEMPAELASLQSQYSSMPDCMYEYVVHFHPPMENVVRQFRYRFMTVRGMWRYERLDDNGLVFYKLCFDGKVFHQFLKECDIGTIRPQRPDPRTFHPFFTGNNAVVLIPNPLPVREKQLAATEFMWNPLFAPVEMPFLARPAAFKTPDLHSDQLWKEVLRRSAIRHRTPAGTPANQVHFLFDDEALNGVLKLEKVDTPGLPPWRVLEHDYMTRAGSMHVVTKYEDWRRFQLEEKEGKVAVLHMPVLTTITSKGEPQSTVLTLELLPDTVAKATRGLTIEDFRIPETITTPSAQVVDLTVAPTDGAAAKTAKVKTPVKTPAASR
ncbi:MAG: hypothetical protein ACAH88_10320, partial [Roseimicrobium sp.]